MGSYHVQALESLSGFNFTPAFLTTAFAVKITAMIYYVFINCFLLSKRNLALLQWVEEEETLLAASDSIRMHVPFITSSWEIMKKFKITLPLRSHYLRVRGALKTRVWAVLRGTVPSKPNFPVKLKELVPCCHPLCYFWIDFAPADLDSPANERACMKLSHRHRVLPKSTCFLYFAN